MICMNIPLGAPAFATVDMAYASEVHDDHEK